MHAVNSLKRTTKDTEVTETFLNLSLLRALRVLCGQSEISIRGNNGTGFPTTCPSGNFPHSASASENRFSFPLNSDSIFQFNWSKIPCADFGSTGEIQMAIMRRDSARW